MEQDPLIGKQIGAYLIQSKVGEGGMAQVYKAYHARLRRDVAIKVILPQVADKESFRERFEREAQLVANLEHRNIVAVYDFGETDNLTYLVMQYVGGGTLRDQMRTYGRIEPHRAVQYTIQMARALHHAHQRGIVHRDVKPQNMLISASDPNEILLSDFGIAKLFDSGDSHETLVPSSPGYIPNDSSLTNIGQIVGTAEYMAPEQINHQPVDARTDIYALGIVLFQMLTGATPFTSTTVQGLLFQHVYTQPKYVRELNPNIPVVLEQIIAQALAKAPAQRFQSAEAMAVALEAVFASPTHQLNTSVSNYGQTLVTSPSQLAQSSQSSQAYSTYGTQLGPQSMLSGVSMGQPMGSSAIGSGGIAVQPRRPARRRMQLSYILYALVALVALGLLVYNVVLPALCTNSNFCLFSSPSNPPTSTKATPFHETFQNNDLNWTIGEQDSGNLKATIGNGQYILTIGSVTTTFFPNPSSEGTLPANFTLSAQIMETKGGSLLYGLAFNLRKVGSKVYGYAFVINKDGFYEMLKYDADTQSLYSTLASGKVTNIRASQSNTLQVIVRGNSFTFSVNDVTVPINGANTLSDSDHPYSGGNVGLIVTGPNSGFTATSVALIIP